MEINELLQGREECLCGKSHKCPIEYVIISEKALESLPEITDKYNNVLLVADKNTYSACGERVGEILVERLQNTLIYERSGILVPDEMALEELRSFVTNKTDLIIGVGSGVINDLCKQVSFEKGLPYYIVATAPSMDGYASAGAALILNGMKVTLNAEVPRAIIADLKVLKNAPFNMIQSGYGDIIGKYSCLNDWRLSNLINGEYLCNFVLNETLVNVQKTVKIAEDVKRRDANAIKTLMESLVAVGILMAYVGNSRPASGSEHHLSHYFEIVGLLRGEEYFSHGIDVCFAAIDTAKIRETLLKIDNIEDFNFRFDEQKYEDEIKRIYGALSDEVMALQQKLGWYKEDRLPIYKEKWQKIKNILDDCPSSMEMLALAEKIGLDYSEYKSLYGGQKLKDAYLYAKDLKDRYSVLWLYFDLMA